MTGMHFFRCDSISGFGSFGDMMMDFRCHTSSKFPSFLSKLPFILLKSQFEMLHFQATTNIPKVCQEPLILQGSNLKMVDRGLLERVPDILDI